MQRFAPIQVRKHEYGIWIYNNFILYTLLYINSYQLRIAYASPYDMDCDAIRNFTRSNKYIEGEHIRPSAVSTDILPDGTTWYHRYYVHAVLYSRVGRIASGRKLFQVDGTPL
jgi:hypothetical protein